MVFKVFDLLVFWCEYVWVVLNFGMCVQVVVGIWVRVWFCVFVGESVGKVFGYKGKVVGIDYVFVYCDCFFVEYLVVENKIEWLCELLWVGDIIKWYLVKNFGYDCVKLDCCFV